MSLFGAASSLESDVLGRLLSLETAVQETRSAVRRLEDSLASATARCNADVAAAAAAAEARVEARLAALEALAFQTTPLSGDTEASAPHVSSPRGRRVLLSGDGARPYQLTQITHSGIVTEHLNVTGDMNIEGNLYWHGFPVGFQPPTSGPTQQPSPHPTHEPTTAIEHIALVQNGYALVGRAYGPGTAFHPCSSNWASASTISPDKCGSCTTDMKNSLWSTLASNQLLLCFGPGKPSARPSRTTRASPCVQSSPTTRL
jgi:hypothetical protein